MSTWDEPVEMLESVIVIGLNKSHDKEGFVVPVLLPNSVKLSPKHTKVSLPAFTIISTSGVNVIVSIELHPL